MSSTPAPTRSSTSPLASRPSTAQPTATASWSVPWTCSTIRPLRPCLLTPTDGQTVPPGDVTFSWTSVPDATSYDIQIEPDGLIDQTVPGTSYTHSFTTLGTRYLARARLPGGGVDCLFELSPSPADVVQVTTDPADDMAPALVQTADGKLLTVFVRNGNLWSRASTDGGATWGAETWIDGCCRYNPSLARAADGTLWLVYDRNGDIWYRTSADQRRPWSAETQLTTDPTSDYDPVIFQATDGKLWVVWHSSRYWLLHPSGTRPARMAASPGRPRASLPAITDDHAPTATVDCRMARWWWSGSVTMGCGSAAAATAAPPGRMRHRSPTGAATSPAWRRSARICGWSYERDGDIWYRTSTDAGTPGRTRRSSRASQATTTRQRWQRCVRQRRHRLEFGPQRQPRHLVRHPRRAGGHQPAALRRMDRAPARAQSRQRRHHHLPRPCDG